jgi:acetyl coenzyme A synthetase (ADP forming)-like protein
MMRTMDPFGQSRHALDMFFAPRNVAIVGASERPGSVGRAVTWNLLTNPFGGAIFPVNRERGQVLGLKTWPSVSAIPEPVDLAVIATPAPGVVGVLRECAAAGARGAVVISAGFRESGPEGAQREQEILAIVRESKMRVVGPNCLGVMCPHTGLNATFAIAMARKGNVAFLSQSAALQTAILDWSLQEQVGFSAFVSLGSMLDVSFGDLIDHLDSDGQTKSILVYMESVGDARAFLSAAREVALRKPIIVLKGGRTAPGAGAVFRHTGSVAGSDEALTAAFRRTGILRVDSIADLFYMADALSKQPRPRGKRLTIVANAGGPAVLAADALVAGGGELAEPTPQAAGALDAALPPGVRRDNPLDLFGDATPDQYERALAAVAGNPQSDGHLFILTPQHMSEPLLTAERLAQHVHSHPDKPMLASWMGGSEVTAARRALASAGIPSFGYPDTAARIFNYMWKYSYNLRGLYETPSMTEGEVGGREAAAAIVQAARKAGRTELDPAEAREVAAAYAIPIGAPRGAKPFELRLCSFTEAEFGPVLSFSAGGSPAESLDNRSLALPPLNTTLARRMMEQTKIHRVLRAASLDLLPLEKLAVRFSQLVVEQPAIREINLHPLFVSQDELVAGGVHIVLHGADVPDDRLPKPVIRPYPSQFVGTVTLRDGETLAVRPIRPEDEPLTVRFHQTLSEQSVFYRYAGFVKLDTRVAHERLSRLAFIDYDREMALVAERAGEIVGIARLVRLRATRDAEFALIISDAEQGKGLGTALLRRLFDVGRDWKLLRIVAEILPDNYPMRRVCEELGFKFHGQTGAFKDLTSE